MAAGTLRVASQQDAGAIAAIYAPYVEKTNISFEIVPPAAGEMARRIAHTLPRHPWIVYEAGGEVLGYAYAHAYGERACYGWSAESSVYIAGGARGNGLGGALYRALEGLLAAQNIRTVYALVTHPNPASDGFHLAFGYEKQGYFSAVGYKFGLPVGVTHYAKALLPVCENPPPVVPFAALGQETVRNILQAALV